MRSWEEATEAPEFGIIKRQSLIPFPRTGKRSGTTESGSRENDQIYIYGDESDEEEDEPEAEPESEPYNYEEVEDVVFDDDEPESESLGSKTWPLCTKCTKKPPQSVSHPSICTNNIRQHVTQFSQHAQL